MLFAAPQWVIESGVIFGSLVAFGTFCGLVARSPIGRWFTHQLTEQAEEWVERISRDAASHALAASKASLDVELERHLEEVLPRHLRPVLYELRANGGRSFRDQVMDQLRELQLRHDRVALFMDESAMDRRDLRRLYENDIARTQAARRGEVDDREDERE